MSILNKLWSMIMAIIPRWILTIPLFLYFKNKPYHAHREAFVNMMLGDSWFKDDNFLESISNGELPKGLQRELMPGHVAVILDGNRRWAKQRGLASIEGYEAGFATLGKFLTLCRKWKIPIVSLFMFSTENWLRPKEEVEFLLDLFERALKYYLLHTSHRHGGRVSVIGDKISLPISLQKAIKQIEEATKDNTEFHLICAISYSGQNDILHACQSIGKKVKDGLVQPEDITKSLVEQHLQTNVTDLPSPDLLIRTSGEIRVSNYYLWQSAYTEMYFTNALWPDFEQDEFIKALSSFQQRGRRFGKV